MPATPPEIPYDVFISYSHTDSDWVFEWLIPRLKDAGLQVCTDRESFALGVPAVINMENAVATSRHTLLVLTPAYLASNWTMYEQILTQTQDPIGLRQRTIPVLRQPCEPPMRIAMLTYADLTGKRDAEAEFGKIVRALGGTSRPPQADQPKAQPPAPSSPVQAAYNTAAVRELLMAAFSDEELMTFCYDSFRRVYEEFTAGMSRTQKVQMLLDYCVRRDQMVELLAGIERANPYQYARFEERLRSVQPQSPKPPDPTPLPDPLPANPFADPLAIRDPERFIRRETNLMRLTTLLEGGSVALLGEPKIGMSSMLRQLADTWQGTAIGPVNCQDLEDRNDFYEHLARALGISDTSWRSIRQELKTRPVLLLLDEMDAAPGCGMTPADLGRLRAVAGSNRSFRVVCVSHRPLRDVFPGVAFGGSPAYDFLQPLSIGPISEVEARDILAHPWAPNALIFDSATCDSLVAIARGHPLKLYRAAFHRYRALVDSLYDWQVAYQQDLEHLL